MPEARPVRFRHNVAVGLAGIVGIVAAIPLAGSRWYLAPLLVVPVLMAAWGWRSGVDVDTDGVTVRAMVGSRRFAWREITGFTTQRRRVYVLLGERAVALPAVTPDDVPALIEAGGQDLDIPPSDINSRTGDEPDAPDTGEPDEDGPDADEDETDAGEPDHTVRDHNEPDHNVPDHNGTGPGGPGRDGPNRQKPDGDRAQ